MEFSNAYPPSFDFLLVGMYATPRLPILFFFVHLVETKRHVCDFLIFFCRERLSPSSKNENPNLHIYMRKCKSTSIPTRILRGKWFKKLKISISEFEILAPTPQAASTFLLIVFHMFFFSLLISAPKSRATLRAVPWNQNRMFIPRRAKQIEVRKKNRSDGGWRRGTF